MIIGFVARVAGLVTIYLLVLTSTAPGDILVGTVLAVVIVGASRPSHHSPPVGWLRWTYALAMTLLGTGGEMAVGTLRTIRFALGGRARPGFVEIPRGNRSRRAVALWGVLTGEAPDEYPVDVDPTRDVLIVHVLDASDPDRIRARHALARERWQRHVVE